MNAEQAAPQPDAPPTHPVVPAAPRLSPTTAKQRFVFLDFLRGVALLGILPENIPFFAIPLSASDDAAWADPNGWVGAFAFYMTRFFGDYKFFTLFSLMFGVGLALIHQRCEASARPFRRLFCRRVAVLFVLGVMHAWLLWYGDILCFYALAGLVAMFLVDWEPRKLRRIGIGLICVPVVAIPLFGAGMAVIQYTAVGEGSSFLQDVRVRLRSDETDKEPLPENFAELPFSERMKYLYEYPEPERLVYAEGSFLQITFVRALTWAIGLLAMGIYMEWRILGLFLIGMSLLKAGWFVRPQDNMPRFRKLRNLGLLIGLPFQTAAVALPLLGADDAVGKLFAECFQYVGGLGFGLVYAWLIAAVYVRAQSRPWIKPLICVGRCALSNYILMSIVCSFVFYSYGLALFGRLNRFQLWYVIPIVWLICLIFATLWMSRFQHGPLEWIWRKLTYGGRVPMRR